MIKNNKWKAIVSSVLILLPALLGGIFWKQIAASLTGMRLFPLILPLILLCLHWIALLITAHDNQKNQQSLKVLRIVFWIVPAVSLYANAILYSILLGMELDFYAILCIAIGLPLILIGNYMPKCKKNHTVGLRTKWTFSSEENWTKTHRLCGKTWVAAGILCLLSLFLPKAVLPHVPIALLLIACAVPMLYSYLLFRKQVKNGLVPKKVTSDMPTWAKILTTVLLTVILAGVLILCFTGTIKAECTDNALTVKATYWSDLELEYTEIDAIEYRESVDGERINGFGTPKMALGWFRNEEFGNYTRYTYTQTQPCVVLTVDGTVIVLNRADEASTQQLYQELIARIGG